MNSYKIFIFYILLLNLGCQKYTNPEKYYSNKMIKLANEGDHEAQNWLSIQYSNGSKFISKDRNLFYVWVRKSAEQGNVEAQYSLATTLLIDKMDIKEIIYWYNKCASSGDGKWQSESLIALAKLTFDGVDTGYNTSTAYQIITKAALQKNPAACHILGVLILVKASGAEAFYTAKTLIEQGSNGGFVKSHYLLGLLYWKSSFLGNDLLKASELIRKAAEQGYPEAQYVYSGMLRNGTGIKKDIEAARLYEEKAKINRFSGHLITEKIKIP